MVNFFKTFLTRFLMCSARTNHKCRDRIVIYIRKEVIRLRFLCNNISNNNTNIRCKVKVQQQGQRNGPSGPLLCFPIEFGYKWQKYFSRIQFWNFGVYLIDTAEAYR